MAETRLTGSRIRERRIASAIKQTNLAKEVGISPAYLNLIEHNRRRIGGKLVADLARALGCEPAQLLEGAEDALVAALRDAAARAGAQEAQTERAADFAGRFPGWAALVGDQARRISELERLAETLTDRLAHDPHLAASLHEIVSAVTAIRSAGSILAEPDLAADWRARFLRNVGEESRRLSESAEGLVAWLDAGGELAERPVSPGDELGAFVAETGYHFGDLEAPRAGTAEIDALIAGAPVLADAGAAELARAMLTRYHHDARAMPAGAFATSRAASGDDPARLATSFGVGLDAVLRRAAALGGAGAGLVVCDGSGTLTLKKPVAGFDLPRFGAGCTLWPLYQALARPAQPVAAVVVMPGRIPAYFRVRAVALPRAGSGFDAPLVLEATMLVEPVEGAGDGPVTPVGSTCRICPRDACVARREPSILGAEGR